MQRLRSSGTSIFRKVGAPNLRRKALNSWSAVQDTYFSTKDVFERHKVVFTIGTSIASVATAWAGYSIRYYHQTKVDERLDSIEKASHLKSAKYRRSPQLYQDTYTFLFVKTLQPDFLGWIPTTLTLMKRQVITTLTVKSKHVIEHDEIKKIVAKGNVSTAACIATAGTALLIGYGFGWRGGLWYANRRLRKEQMKLLGQLKPRKWQLKFLKRPFGRLRGGSSDAAAKDTTTLH